MKRYIYFLVGIVSMLQVEAASTVAIRGMSAEAHTALTNETTAAILGALGAQPTNATTTRLSGIGAGVSGDVIFRDVVGWTNLPIGIDGKVLKLVGGFPSWETDSTGVGATGDDIWVNHGDVVNPNLTNAAAAEITWTVSGTNVWPVLAASIARDSELTSFLTEASAYSLYQGTNATLTAWAALATSAKQNAFTTGAGVTNVTDVLSANLAEGANITLTTGANGQITIASTASGGGGGTNMMVAALAPDTTVAPTFNIAGLSTTAASCRRLTVRVAMTNNVTTVSAPAGTLIDGDVLVLEFIQDGTGSRTITGWDAKYVFGTDITGITLTTTASKRDFASFVYNSTSDKWYVVGFVRGY